MLTKPNGFPHGYCHKHEIHFDKPNNNGKCPLCEKQPSLAGPGRRVEAGPNVKMRFSRKLLIPEILFMQETEE